MAGAALAALAALASLELSTPAFAIVGMSTLFPAVVRAPVTGIVLISEMSATTSLVIPMAVAAAAAVATATLLKGAPIYDTLRVRMLERT